MKRNLFRLAAILAAFLLTLLLMPLNAGAASAGDYCNIVSVEGPVGDDDMLIRFDDNGTKRYGIFHRDGSITPLYVDEDACRRLLLPDINVRMPYDFGVLPGGYYYEQVEHDLMRQGRFRILNRRGDPVYYSPFDESQNIVGAYEDRILVLKRVSGFTEDTWKLSVIDPAGNPLGEDVDIGSVGRVILSWGIQNLGQGLFGMDNATDSMASAGGNQSAFFDINRNVFFMTSRWSMLRSFPADGGSAVWVRSENHKSVGFEIFPGSLTDADTLQSVPAAACPAEEFRYDVEQYTVGEGLYYYQNAFYTYAGDLAFTIPDYGSSVQIVDVGRFHHGYAPMVMIGADKRYYITMLNRSGEAVYEPVKMQGHDDFWGYTQQEIIDGHTAYGVDVMIDRGYVYYCAYRDGDDTFLITPDGTEIKLPLTDSSAIGMINGYVAFTDCLLDVENPSQYITQGYIEDSSGMYFGPDYSGVWIHDWTGTENPESRLTITGLGNGKAHLEIHLAGIPETFEADITMYDYEFIDFTGPDDSFYGVIRIEPAMGGLLGLSLSVSEDHPLYDTFMNAYYLFETDNPPDLTEYGWEEVDYPDTEDWVGMRMAESDGHRSYLSIQNDGVSGEFMIAINLDGIYSFSCVGVWEDPWTLTFDTDNICGWLFLNPSNGDITLSGAHSPSAAVEEILSHLVDEISYIKLGN